MRFSIPTATLVKLRALQEGQGLRDEFAEREDAFLLDPGLGPAAYLTADGRVLLDFTGWDERAMREATNDEAISYIVVGAKKTGVSELIELLPPPPERARTCVGCEGRRWMVFGTDVGSGRPGEIVCTHCDGRGWTE